MFLYVHHHRRDDGDTLFGFRHADERRCFEALIGAHGVGPALALAILVGARARRRCSACWPTTTSAALCLVPGVGKKTAARLLVELKSRLDAGELDSAALASSPGDEGDGSRGSPRADVREALTDLGYGPDEVGRRAARPARRGRSRRAAA